MPHTVRHFLRRTVWTNAQNHAHKSTYGQVFSHLNQAPHDSSDLTETELLAFEFNHDICVVDNHFAARVKTYLDGLAAWVKLSYSAGLVC